MVLPDTALAWLRALTPARADDDLVPAAVTLGLLAHATPAWTGHYVATLDRLIGVDRGDDPTGLRVATSIRARLTSGNERDAPTGTGLAEHLAARWPTVVDGDAWHVARDLGTPDDWARLLDEPLAPCPQVVDVDTDLLVLRRAEWWQGGLYLELAPWVDDPGRRTMFRVVGTEPRLWFQAGIDGATTDTTSHGMIVRAPLVTGVLEFTPSSY